MRKRRDNMVDNSLPVDIKSISVDPEDCFGNEWASTHKECVNCSEYNKCMVITLSSGNAEKIEEIREGKNFLDELDWDAVPWFEIFENVLETPGEVTLSEVREVVKHFSKVQDEVTMNAKINNWLFENNIKVKEGCLQIEE